MNDDNNNKHDKQNESFKIDPLKKLESNLKFNSNIGNVNHKFKIFCIFSSSLVLSGFFVFPYIKRYYANKSKNHAEITHICYFDIDVNNMFFGRVDIGLYSKSAPKSIGNFLSLVSNEHSIGYMNSVIHKIIPQHLISGGDIVNKDGTGNYSVYNNQLIEDEIDNNLTFKVPGVVGLCNKGESEPSNGSQFFITLDQIPNLTGKYTIIGEVIEGLELLKHLSVNFGNLDGSIDPEINIKISKCGLYVYDEYVMDKRKLSKV
jgi:peptidyl-prolyl cis-trans isomerase B (cyclophilin B)